MFDEVVIVDAARSPIAQIGRREGLGDASTDTLLAQTAVGLVSRIALDGSDIDAIFASGVRSQRLRVDVVSRDAELPGLGCMQPVGSGLEGIARAARALRLSPRLVALAASVKAPRARHDQEAATSVPEQWASRIKPVIAAEKLASRWKLSRDQLDEYAKRSFDRAAECQAAGDYEREIVSIERAASDNGANEVVRQDEFRRLDRLELLDPLLSDFSSSHENPDFHPTVTAGNSAGRAVGAAAVMLTTARRAGELGLRPRARLRRIKAISGDAVRDVLNPPASATRSILSSCARSVEEMDHIEIPETFASTALAWQAEFDVCPDLVNPRGGAIAMGDLSEASGLRALNTMLGALEDTGGTHGLLVAMESRRVCYAMVVERC